MSIFKKNPAQDEKSILDAPENLNPDYAAQKEKAEQEARKTDVLPAGTAVASGSGKKSKKGRIIDKRNKMLKRFSVGSTILVIIILLIVNIAFDSLLGDILKWDWSTGEQYSIGDVSEEILDAMMHDVQIVGLFEKETDGNYQNIQRMLDEYAQKSNGRITLRYVDPVANPSILTEVDPDNMLKPEENTFVVFCPDTGKAKSVGYYDIFDVQYDQQSYQSYLNGVTAEQSFSGAIKYVLSDTTPVIYFTSGHNELDYAAEYSVLVGILQNNNFEVAELELFDLNEIPADCAALIMAAPESDITVSESKVLSAYLKAGGSLLVITNFSNARYTNLNTLLIDFNIEISNDKVREGNINYRYNDNPYIIRGIAPTSTISSTEVDGFTLADNVRGINELKNAKEWIKVEPVLTTSDQGVAETGGDADQSSAAGIQNIGLMCENSGWVDSTTVTQTAKVIVVGSSSLFADAYAQYTSQLYNASLFYNGIRWLSNTTEEESLYIKAKEVTSYYVNESKTSVNVFTAVVVMVILPGILLLTALFVYRKRKHL